MDNQELKVKLNNFKKQLEKEYFGDLPNEVTLEDFKNYDTSFVLSNDFSEKIRNYFIEKCSEWKIGDKFIQIKTVFYPSREEIVKSIVWEITSISIHNGSNGALLTYWTKDANDNYFPKRTSFNNLKSVDITNEKGVRTKYHFEKITK
jgi:hypothetical protein